MENNTHTSKYFSPQGTITLADDKETLHLGNCSKFTIRGNKFILRLEDFCTYNLAKIFNQDLVEITDEENSYTKTSVVYNTFKPYLSTKKWKLRLNGVNSSDNNAPFQITGIIEFTQVKEFNFLNNTFSHLDFVGNIEDLRYADAKSFVDGKADFTKSLATVTKKDLVKVNQDLFKVNSAGAIYNRRDIVKIYGVSNTRTEIKFINTSIEVAEPFNQVAKFFERYEDENKAVKAVDRFREDLAEHFSRLVDENFWNVICK